MDSRTIQDTLTAMSAKMNVPKDSLVERMANLNFLKIPANTSDGHLSALLDQDRAKWDRQLLAEGLKLMELSASGPQLSEYHVEAAIASIHGRASGMENTDWKAIVSLYDTLTRLRRSPIIGLNRAIAVGHLEGPARGLEELDKIVDRERLVAYPFYFAALGEFELRMERHDVARERFRAAAALARSPMEREFLIQRLTACGTAGAS